MGLPAGRSRIGLVKGVVPMPKLPESGHRDKSGHCCIAQLFGVGASGSPGSQGTGSLPQAATALRDCSRIPASTIVRVYTPGSRLFPGAAASENLFAQLCGFISQAAGWSWQQFPGSCHQEDLHNCAGFFPDASMQLLPFSTRHTLKKSC